MFEKFFKKKEEQQIEFLDKNLYILSEIPKPGIVSYLEANGVHVKKIVTDIDAMILSLIRERDPIRLIIIDFGTGKWKTLDAINNIVGLVSQCTSEDSTKSTTLFTRNGAITKELKDRKIKVDVRDYKGISDIIRALMEYPENYVTPGAKEFDGAPISDLSAFRYNRDNTDSYLKNSEKLDKFRNANIIDITEVDVQAGGENLTGYNCKF